MRISLTYIDQIAHPTGSLSSKLETFDYIEWDLDHLIDNPKDKAELVALVAEMVGDFILVERARREFRRRSKARQAATEEAHQARDDKEKEDDGPIF